MTKCRYIDEREFADFKENFHTLIETLNHSVTDIKEDLNSVRTNSALMNNSLRNINKILWGVVGVLSTIAVSVLIAVITKVV
jgi:hypothetical protein